MHKGKEGLPSALQTINIAQMLEHYRLSEEDASRLHALQPLMEKAVDDLLPGFYEFIFSFEHARIFLHGEEILQKHSSGIRQWFIALFAGPTMRAIFSSSTASVKHMYVSASPLIMSIPLSVLYGTFWKNC